MEIIGLVATNEDGIIGVDGKLPWHDKEDLKFFKKQTDKEAVVYGRKTQQSLPKGYLPGRFNIILSNQLIRIDHEEIVSLSIGGVNPKVFNLVDVDAFINYISSIGIVRLYIVGGTSIYDLFINHIDTLIVTNIDHEVVDGGGEISKFPEYHKLSESFNEKKDVDIGGLSVTIYTNLDKPTVK